MYRTLPTSVKSNITRSISKQFEQYMAGIEWKEERFDIESFLKVWRRYILESAKWYDELSDEVKASNEFHEDLAEKMNQTISKILMEPPSAEQVEKLEALQKEKNITEDYSCKAEAAYILNKWNR